MKKCCLADMAEEGEHLQGLLSAGSVWLLVY